VSQLPKKTSKLETRVDWNVKQRFVERCRLAGESVSDRLRLLVSEDLAVSAERPVGSALAKKLPTVAACVGLLTGAVALFSIPAQALNVPLKEYRALDMDGDGHVTLEEFLDRNALSGEDERFRQHLRTEFARADKDGDGIASREEIITFATAKHRALFDCFDRDGSGRLLLSEWVEASGPCEAFAHGYTMGVNMVRDLDYTSDEAAKTAAMRGESFASIDEDRDGDVSWEEFLLL